MMRRFIKKWGRIKIIFLFFLSSCALNNKELNGNWAVLEITYQGEEIFVNESRSGISVTNSMIIEKDRILFIINAANPAQLISTKFAYGMENGNEIIQIIESDDKRFIGTYRLKIKENEFYSNSGLKEFSIELVSDDIKISGLKYLTKI